MSKSSSDLYELLAAPKALPVLFVGSGISRRYIGAPDWNELLSHFAQLNRRPYAYYRGLADGDLPKIASLIAEEFYELWWKSTEYAGSRQTYAELVENRSDPLKIEVANFISSLSPTADADLALELEQLPRIHTHAVITTNWDTLIERALPDLQAYIGQSDVLFSSTKFIGEIYKIHGSVTVPSSLVLTREDYETYWERNPYLIAKMLTLFVEHPVVFMGYSLRDKHIQKLLENLVGCLSGDQLNVLQERLVFVGRTNASRGKGLNRSSMTLGSHTIGIFEYGADHFNELYDTLALLPQHFPVKLLRQLRESVYEMAFATKPKGRIYVLPFDADNDLDKVEVVVGVGMMDRLGERGYKQFSRRDLFLDMLRCDRTHNTQRLMQHLIPSFFKSATYSPIFYPMYLAEILSEDGTPLELSSIPERAKLLVDGVGLRPLLGRDGELRMSQTFRELLSENTALAENYGLNCVYEIDDVIALRRYLIESLDSSETVRTPIAKLGCKFDRLVYGPAFKGKRSELWASIEFTKDH